MGTSKIAVQRSERLILVVPGRQNRQPCIVALHLCLASYPMLANFKLSTMPQSLRPTVVCKVSSKHQQDSHLSAVSFLYASLIAVNEMSDA